MQVRCWGARGSIPVSGDEYRRFGGDTTCVEVRGHDGHVVIIDAGTGIRRLGLRLQSERPAEINLLFTHAHWDHLMGFPFFQPLYESGRAIRIFGCPCAQDSVREMVSESMEPPHFPVPLHEVGADLTFRAECSKPFEVGGLIVTPFPLSHPNGGLGYAFAESDRRFVFLTDNELGFRHPGGPAFEDYVGFCSGADLLFHDAEFRPEEYDRRRGWGHSTCAEAVDLALEANVKRLGLIHHDPERADDQVDAIVAKCRDRLGQGAAVQECFAVAQGMALCIP